MQNAQLEAWTGDFGNAYTVRNVSLPLAPRVELWRNILARIPERPQTILEVGANLGQNLVALRELAGGLWHPYLAAVEPNGKARSHMIEHGISAYPGHAGDLQFGPGSFDLVFTCGVLIHVNPKGEHGHVSALTSACKEIARVSKKWVVAIEYFSDLPREIRYRGQDGLLWVRDFGQFYMDACGLIPEACGFKWRPLTGLDNLTWWLLRKA